MDKQEQKPTQGNTSEQRRNEQPESPLPPGKEFQVMLVQTVVFAAVFFTILWLVEDHSPIAAFLGLSAIAYLLWKKLATKD